MEQMKELENQFYKARYGLPKEGNEITIWEEIKKSPEVLREAVKIKRNKWDNGDIVSGLTICDAILKDYESVDQEAYRELIQSIYTNLDIARIVMKGDCRESTSFLLMSLWNPNLKLTQEQKNFAIADTMNSAQVHGIGSFDIRYHILRNANWTLEEKQKLIMDFWDSDEVYDECVEDWEWNIVNDSANYKGRAFPSFDRYQLMYEYTYDMLLAYYGDKKTTDRIWEEMEFCRQMHELRPQQWEIKTSPQKVLTHPIQQNKC